MTNETGTTKPSFKARDLARQSSDELIDWLKSSWEPILFGWHKRLYELDPFSKHYRQAHELADVFAQGYLEQPEEIREKLEKAILKRLGGLATRVSNKEEAYRWWFYLSTSGKIELRSVGTFAGQYFSVKFIDELLGRLPSNLTSNVIGLLINNGPNHASGVPIIHTVLKSSAFPDRRSAEVLARLFQLQPENSKLHLELTQKPLKLLFDRHEDVEALQQLKNSLARAFDRFVGTHFGADILGQTETCSDWLKEALCDCGIVTKEDNILRYRGKPINLGKRIIIKGPGRATRKKVTPLPTKDPTAENPTVWMIQVVNDGGQLNKGSASTREILASLKHEYAY